MVWPVIFLATLALGAWAAGDTGRPYVAWAGGWLWRIFTYPFLLAAALLTGKAGGVGGGSSPPPGKAAPPAKAKGKAATPPKPSSGKRTTGKPKGRRRLPKLPHIPWRKLLGILTGLLSLLWGWLRWVLSSWRGKRAAQGGKDSPSPVAASGVGPSPSASPAPPSPATGGGKKPRNFAPTHTAGGVGRSTVTSSLRSHTVYGMTLAGCIQSGGPSGGTFLIQRHRDQGIGHGLMGQVIALWDIAVEQVRIAEVAELMSGDARGDETHAAQKAAADALETAVNAVVEAAVFQSHALAPLFDAADATAADLNNTPPVAALRAA